MLFNKGAFLVHKSWQAQTNSAWEYFGFLVLCFFWLIRENIMKLSLSFKDGLQAELKQIEIEKGELRKVYICLQKLRVTLVQNSNRWCGWNNARINKEMQNAKEEC